MDISSSSVCFTINKSFYQTKSKLMVERRSLLQQLIVAGCGIRAAKMALFVLKDRKLSKLSMAKSVVKEKVGFFWWQNTSSLYAQLENLLLKNSCCMCFRFSFSTCITVHINTNSSAAVWFLVFQNLIWLSGFFSYLNLAVHSGSLYGSLAKFFFFTFSLHSTKHAFLY